MRIDEKALALIHICPHCFPDSGGCGANHIPPTRIGQPVDCGEYAAAPTAQITGGGVRIMIDRWKLAKWLYDVDAEVDSHGVQLIPWEDREQRTRDAYFSLAGECIEAVTLIEVQAGDD